VFSCLAPLFALGVFEVHRLISEYSTAWFKLENRHAARAIQKMPNHHLCDTAELFKRGILAVP
jgi:hypothetical protein